MTNSSREFERAQRRIPGGVNSPVRAFRAVGGTPVFFERAEGALLFDVDSKRYVDYVGTWGPAVVGHAHPRVVEAVREAAGRGLSFGAPTVLETEMAERVCALVPSMDKVRMVSSGTEAALSAVRLARGFTGRDAIVKFEGCYHGHADSLLVKAGSGALTFGVPTSPGVPAGLAEHTLTWLQRRRGRARGVRQVRRPDRRSDRRADRRQHELRAPRAGLPGIAARVLRRARRGAHLRTK